MDTSDLDFDDSFNAPFRTRSNTWPTNRQGENLGLDLLNCKTLETCQEIGSTSSFTTLIPSTANSIYLDQDDHLDQQEDLSPQSQLKKNGSRRNAWGNMSYADLITQAIQQSNDQRLTLSQIYEWMVHNVDYFKDKGDSNSSAGWKNSIRHNLSLHNRFMRVQNDGAGKSSWWMINPEAKPGKAARRRAVSIETKTYEKRKGRYKKKTTLTSSLPGFTLLDHSPCSSISEGLDNFPESPAISNGQQVQQQQVQQQQVSQNVLIYTNANNSNNLINKINSPDHSFRTRNTSNESSCGRLSPLEENKILTPLSPLNNWNNNGQNSYDPSEVDIFTDQLESLVHTINLGSETGANVENTNHNVTNNTITPNYDNTTDYINNDVYVANSYSNCMINNASNQVKMNNTMCKSTNNVNINNCVSNLRTNDNNSNPNNIIMPNSNCFSPNNLINNTNNVDMYFSGQVECNTNEINPQLVTCTTSSNTINNDDKNNNRIYTLTNLSPNSLSPNTSELNNNNNTLVNNYIPDLRNDQTNRNVYSLNGVNGSDNLRTNGMFVNNQMANLNQFNTYFPNDLDPNLYSQQSALDCDMDFVIRQELTYEGNLDFNFESIQAHHGNNTNTPPSNTLSNPTATSKQSWVH